MLSFLKNPLLAMMFQMLVGQLTPMIQQHLKLSLQNLYGLCKETDNPFDDVLIGTLMGILGVPTPVEKKVNLGTK